MIESYLAAHGTITRTQAADLCMVDPEEAGRILSKLVDERRLTRQGAKRGTYYMLNQAEPLKPLAGAELKDLVRTILEETSPLSLQEIDDALRVRGYEVAGNNKRNYLTSLMSRNKNLFNGLGRGYYELKA
jgi:hypothetical protein